MTYTHSLAGLALSVLLVGPAAAQVTLHQHCNYHGYSVDLNEGYYDLDQLRRMGMRNDDVSAVRVPSGWRVTVYEHAGFQGRSMVLTADDGCFVSSNFNDILSSAVVERAPETVNGYNVNYVDYGSGAFIQNGDRWTEVKTRGDAAFHFQEMARDEWSVYLYDRSRNVSIQLDLWRKTVLYGAGRRATQDLYRIDGASAHYEQTY